MRQLTLVGALTALTLLFLTAGITPAHAATPIFTITIDDDDSPDSTANPPCAMGQPCLGGIPSGSTIGNDDCVIGVPCEMFQTTDIAAGDPFELPSTSIPKPKFTISNSFYGAGDPDNIPNGTAVAAMGFTAGVDTGTCSPGVIMNQYPAATLVDAALPDYTGSTWAAHGMPSEGPNAAGPAALFSPLVWGLDLESDAHANALNAAGYPLIARYQGTLPTGGPGTPVNILVFETPVAYISTIILGDPTISSPTFCSPTTTAVDFLGSTSLGQPLRQCNSPGTVQVTGDFPLNSATITDAVSCSGTLPTAFQSGGNFCISGTSTGAGWEWRLFFTKSSGPPDSYEDTILVGPLAGSGAPALATAWAASLGSKPGVTAIPTGSCFNITLNTGVTGATTPISYFLFVAPIGGLECQIGALPTGACSFNPIVYYVPPNPPIGGDVSLSVADGGSQVPTLPIAAVVAAAIAALVMGWSVRKKWNR